MKNYEIRIQPFSALAGACLVALGLTATGAFAPQGGPGSRDVNAIENINDPSPSDYVRITYGSPYTVPSEKIFVLTGIACSGFHTWSNGAERRVEYIENGTAAIYVSLFGHEFANSGGRAMSGALSIMPVPKGVSAPSGTVISTGDDGVLMGYLVDA